MNFLAHLYLARGSKGLLVGNFIADAVKGKQFERYSDEIREGILMHRAIDTYTDTHPVVRQSTARLRGEFGKFAGVITDIFYDHFLAVEWEQYGNMPLSRFAKEVYALMFHHYHLLPDKSKRILPYMANGNWLVRYSQLEGIRTTLKGMDRRTSWPSQMAGSVALLETDYDLFKADFEAFFPDLEKYVTEWERELQIRDSKAP